MLYSALKQIQIYNTHKHRMNKTTQLWCICMMHINIQTRLQMIRIIIKLITISIVLAAIKQSTSSMK